MKVVMLTLLVFMSHVASAACAEDDIRRTESLEEVIASKALKSGERLSSCKVLTTGQQGFEAAVEVVLQHAILQCANDNKVVVTITLPKRISLSDTRRRCFQDTGLNYSIMSAQ